MLLKKILFVNSFLLLFSFQMLSQDTTTIMNLHLKEANLWGWENEYKKYAEFGNGEYGDWQYPIEKATFYHIIFKKDTPVSHQGAIIGNMQNTFIHEVLEAKIDTLKKSKYDNEVISYYQLTQNWSYNKKSNQLEVVTKNFNPILLDEIVFDTETFEEKSRSFNDTKSNVLFKQNPNMKSEEVVNRIVIGTRVFLSQDITKQLLSSIHVFNHEQYTYNSNYETKQFNIIKNMDKDTIPLINRDTILFDPVTFEEVFKVVEWPVYFNEISFHIVYELLFDANNQITTNILGLRPYQYLYTTSGHPYADRHDKFFTIYTKEIFPYMKQGDLYRIGFNADNL